MATNKNDVFNPFKVAAESFQASMEAGVNFQKDAMKMFSDAITGNTAMDGFRDRVDAASKESAEMIRKNAEQSQKLFQDNCKVGLDMLHKGTDFVGSGADRSDDMFGNAREMWQSTFEALTANAQTVADNCSQTVEQWSECLGNVCTEAAKVAPADSK